MNNRNLWAGLALTVSIGLGVSLWHYAQAVSQLHARLAQVMENAPCGIVACDRNSRVLYANQRFTEITGFTSDELKASGLQLIIPAELFADHRSGFAAAAQKKPQPGKTLYTKVLPVICRDGKLLRVHVSIGTVGHEFFAFLTPSTEPQDDLTRELPPADFKTYRTKE